MSTIKLLLAEDDELLASLLNFRLKKGGFDVAICTDGKKIKEYLKDNTPDIIVSDIMMPYFSGLEITDYVRNTLKLDIPIIILSSAGNEENILNAFKLGANDFLSKPVSPAELILRLKKELTNKVI
ncbi:response regulator [Cellulophaga baltica]|uniref:response regulator n=1 Tax=Cellulophaga TaxID=104264 RepID=UPI001C069A9E|nr:MULTISPECIES: response regulator [Cellulophaga]MBU2996230.1 response regulator [Cellulophaga baltica]MDO6767625.1 response regulator [Cellulophaga sp. 1_MG-2023]